MRVVVLALSAVAVAVAGCSSGSSSVSLGLNDSNRPKPIGQPLDGSFSSGSTKKSQKRTRLAKRDDAAPVGAYRKAPKGALADRDYSGSRLNAEAARKAINSYRGQHGLKPLKIDPLLTKAAKMHSRDLAKWDRISHFGSDGSNPWDRVKRAGYKARLAAENVGTGQASLDEVMAGWKKSPGHNKNLLLRDAEHMGIALVQSPNTEFRTFWTLVLGSKI